MIERVKLAKKSKVMFDGQSQEETQQQFSCLQEAEDQPQKQPKLSDVQKPEMVKPTALRSLYLLYEDYVADRILSSRKQPLQCQEEASYQSQANLTCFCGKTSKNKDALKNHIRSYHRKPIDHPDYLEERASLIKNNLKVKDFMLEHAPMLENLKNKRFGLKLPQEMLKIIPNKLLKKMGVELQKLAIKNDQIRGNYYFRLYALKSVQEDGYPLSEEFMESLRELAIRHITDFERKVQITLKNVALKPLFQLFIFNSLSSFARQVPPQIFAPLCRLLECISKHFMGWIDRNYEKTFKKYGIFDKHIALQPHESYSTTERSYRIDCLMREYNELFESLVQVQVHNITIWAFASFWKFITVVVEKDQQQSGGKTK